MAEANVNLAFAVIANILRVERTESISILDKVHAISSDAFRAPPFTANARRNRSADEITLGLDDATPLYSE